MAKHKKAMGIESQKDIEKICNKASGLKLTLKQETFATIYARTGNGTEAAEKAGYKGNNLTLRQIAFQNLTKDNIIKRIEQEKTRINERSQIKIPSPDEVLQGIATIAGTAERESDRLRAWELLGKYHAIFTDKAIIGTVDYAEIIATSRKRVELSTVDGHE